MIRDRHIQYNDGALPDTVDISARIHEEEITIKVCVSILYLVIG